MAKVRDAKTSKATRENLKKIFATSTTAGKLQLRQELSNLRQRDLSMVDYTSKIKDICDSLASIDVHIEESEMVQVCLGGLALKFRAFRTIVCTRENRPSFFDFPVPDPVPDIPTREISNDRTTSKTPGEPEKGLSS